MSLTNTQAWKVFAEGLWKNNPIFIMVLGICSSLAVTTFVKNAFVMYLGVAFATVFTSAIVAAIRKRIPATYRMLVFMMITSTLVIVFDRLLKLTLPAVSKEMGPYVGLIITNCIVMGRSEAFAMSNTPWLSALDGLGVSTGYGLVLLAIAVLREVFGMGTLLGTPVMPGGYQRCGLLISAPGAFLCLTVLLFLANFIREARGEGKK
ncbi:MAG: Na(+)-translocating NADH-quinone reductase subunit D [Candidatus Ozemobacter sibiricus]|jgi:Na+-transporting NADH:ubiquinone oxidoreductase subunit D|uniref:Na(+)-translocating NADH-quinone reductase subunit D n=1 Tax=Candidatus Ozemobacter sibiricus TaxID=2268124 RepID=A0A367ZRK7_9BACT|nr:MAG: Na(+)-translocating NADH-quinone reductase subunit D [Candidatus Ozemobacter sibiricus]